mgnify:CR=1 FL=1
MHRADQPLQVLAWFGRSYEQDELVGQGVPVAQLEVRPAVRLAAQLTGWKLDIISESKFKQMEEETISQLGRIEGVSEAVARNLYRMGFRALDNIASVLAGKGPIDPLWT